MKIGFVSSGNSGVGVLNRLLSLGHEVIVYNHSLFRADDLLEKGARIVQSPFHVTDADLVISMISDDKEFETVVYGEDGLMKTLRPDTIHISMGKISSEFAEQLHMDHLILGTHFVGAPVFGDATNAETGHLFFAVAGECEVLEKCQGIFNDLSRQVFRVSNTPSLALQCH